MPPMDRTEIEQLDRHHSAVDLELEWGRGYVALMIDVYERPDEDYPGKHHIDARMVQMSPAEAMRVGGALVLMGKNARKAQGK